jgi:ribosomal protein RSM22 (predicted rRNA methylase)
LAHTPQAARPARVLAQPQMSKVAIHAKLCTATGIEIATAQRRDKAAYAQFRRLDWGDAIMDVPGPPKKSIPE